MAGLMSGYEILLSQDKNGTNTNSRPEVKIMNIIFVYRMGRVKTNHDNVRIIASHAGNWRYIEEKEVLQILVVARETIYDITYCDIF